MPNSREQETISLLDFAPKEWFNKPERSSFWLRIYTSLFIPHDKFIERIKDATTRLSLPQPVAIGFAVLGGLKVPNTQIHLYCAENGGMLWEVNAGERELKMSNYVLISTPYTIDGVIGNESTARRQIDIASTVICAHTGRNFMRDVIFEGEIEAVSGEYHVPSNPVTVPQMPEGPFLNKRNFTDVEAIIDKLTLLQPERKSRIELSLEFFNKALREEDSFFYYWTALEILCNGKAQTIRHRIKECYSFSNLKDVDEKTRFGVIAQWRHDFFHKGLRPFIEKDVERYIQLLYVDLLRLEVHLPLAGHIAAIQRAPGYDLTTIGLSDNRTEQQLEVERKTKEMLGITE